MSNISQSARTLEAATIGREMYEWIAGLYPICRSITGKGLRDTLNRLREYIPIVLHEVPTGTPVFDWTVPKEWNIRDAYIESLRGERIVDFHKSNLHVLNYSVPVDRRVKLAELKQHLFSLPDHPDWIPYRTSYYRENWGFCLTQNQLDQVTDEEYDVRIDSSLENGSLTYGEFVIPGATEDEILISCHACHPSLCNDNLSGIAIATFAAKMLAHCELRYTYRFLFIPGTIGSITWLSLNEKIASRIRHGLVLACLGDRGGMSYKRSRQGNAEIDRAVAHVLKHSGNEYSVHDFSPYGYDERQYCSPGFNLAVGCLSRTPHGKFAEYHTSADNLDFVDPAALGDSLKNCLQVLALLESNSVFLNLNPKCEPQLGKRGLYRTMGGYADAEKLEIAMLWTLNLSDGTNSLLDIAERSDLSFELIDEAATRLKGAGLLEEHPASRIPERVKVQRQA